MFVLVYSNEAKVYKGQVWTKVYANHYKHFIQNKYDSKQRNEIDCSLEAIRQERDLFSFEGEDCRLGNQGSKSLVLGYDSTQFNDPKSYFIAQYPNGKKNNKNISIF